MHLIIVPLSLDHVYLRHLSSFTLIFWNPFLWRWPGTQFWPYFSKTHNLNQFSNWPLDHNSIPPVQLSFPIPRLFLQPPPIPPTCQLHAFNTPPCHPVWRVSEQFSFLAISQKLPKKFDYTFHCSLRENMHSFVQNGDQQREETLISTKSEHLCINQIQ